MRCVDAGAEAERTNQWLAHPKQRQRRLHDITAVAATRTMQGRGIGRELLLALLHYAKQRGAVSVWGDVLADNENMLIMARAMGAALTPSAGAVRTEFRPGGGARGDD